MLSRVDFLNTLMEKAKNDPKLFRHVRLADTATEEDFRHLKNYLMAELAAGSKLTTLPSIDAMFNDKSKYNLTYEDLAYLEEQGKGSVGDWLSGNIQGYFMECDYQRDAIMLYSKTAIGNSLSATALKSRIKNPDDFSDFMLDCFIDSILELPRGLKNAVQVEMVELCGPHALHVACESARKYAEADVDVLNCFIDAELLIEKEPVNGLRCFLVNSKLLLGVVGNNEPLDDNEYLLDVYTNWYGLDQCDDSINDSVFINSPDDAKEQGERFSFDDLYPQTKDPVKALYPSEIKDKFEAGNMVLRPWHISKLDMILAIEKEVDDFLAANASA